METKKIMDKIVNGTNLSAIKTELNELKVLSNSIEAANCQYEQKIATLKEELVEKKKKVNGAINSATANAEKKYNSEKKQLMDAKEETLANINTIINNINELEAKLTAATNYIKDVKLKNEDNEREITESNKIMSELISEYQQELQEFEKEFGNGSVFLNGEPQFFNREDIIRINGLFNKIIKSNKKIAEAKNIAMENAKKAFELAESKHKKHVKALEMDISTSKVSIANRENEIVNMKSEVEESQAIKAAYQETYDAIVVKLKRLEKAYNKEVNKIAAGVQQYKINIKNTDFFSMDDINALNELLKVFIETEYEITKCDKKIFDNKKELEGIAGKVSELEAKIDEIVAAREKCIENVSEAADEAIKVTAKTVGEVANNVEKGLRGASVIGKFAYGQAKKHVVKKATKVMTDLSQDGFFDDEPIKTSEEKNQNIDLKGTIEESMKTISENPIISSLFEGIKESEVTSEDIIKASKNMLEEAKQELLKGFDDKDVAEVKDNVKQFFKQFKGYANPNTNDNESDTEE